MEDPLLSFSQGKLTKGNINLNRNICLIIFCVFFNLATWLCIILTIYLLIFKESHGDSTTFLIIGIIICYWIYFILELSSQTFKFLLSKSGEKIDKVMEKFLKIKPKVVIFFESYHMEQRHSQGGSYEVKVTTFSKTIPLKYISIRDTSGVFTLNISENNIIKYFFKLNVTYEIHIADVATLSQIQAIKSFLERRYSHLDRKNNCEPRIYIDNIKQYQMIKLKDSEPFFTNCFWFICFTLLTLGELYKLYIDRFSIRQTFIIKKFISVNSDLNNDERFNQFNPKLKIGRQIINFELEDAIGPVERNIAGRSNDFILNIENDNNNNMSLYNNNIRNDVGNGIYNENINNNQIQNNNRQIYIINGSEDASTKYSDASKPE
jgi:hypothetical protein